MPPRPPPSPPVLSTLCVLAAAAATWLLVAFEQAVRGAAGSMVGVPWHGLRLPATAPYTVSAWQGAVSDLGAGSVTMMVLAGSVLVPVVGTAVLTAVRLLRTSALTRAMALELGVVGLLWLPTVLVCGGVPGGGGPVGELYERLGSPQAGRWASVALGLLLLGVASPVAARLAVSVGRNWMRADGLAFRRRLVRLQAGYPGALAVGALAVTSGWLGLPWAIAWVLLMVMGLHAATS